MIFDGNYAVEFAYDGKKYHEVIQPEFSEIDPDIEYCWNYRIDCEENLSMILIGEFNANNKLSTTGALCVKIYDYTTDFQTYVDDIDIV